MRINRVACRIIGVPKRAKVEEGGSIIVRATGIVRRIDESKQLVFENHHEPIIDYPTFAYVQEQMKKRTRRCF